MKISENMKHLREAKKNQSTYGTAVDRDRKNMLRESDKTCDAHEEQCMPP